MSFGVAISLVASGLLLSQVARAQIYVGEGPTTIGEFDSTTGAPINASLITSGVAGVGTLALSGNDLYVGNFGESAIGKYDATTGAAINSSLIPTPGYIALSGNDLYVAYSVPEPGFDNFAYDIGVYNATTGAAINATLVADIDRPYQFAVSGNILFVADYATGAVAKYNATTGASINTSFLTNLKGPIATVVSGNDLYVLNNIGETVGEYDATTGAAINASLVSTALSGPFGMALSGNDLYVTNLGNNSNSTVAEFDATTGAVINAALLSSPNVYEGIVVGTQATPEPSTWALLLGGLGLLVFWRRQALRA